MPGLTNQLATNMAAVVAGVAGMAGASPVQLDFIPNTPYAYIGPPKWSQVGGSWEVREYRFPLHILLARTATADREQTAINDLLDLVDATFRTNVTLSGLATSTLLLTADTDLYEDVGGETYILISCDVQVMCMSGQSYTP